MPEYLAALRVHGATLYIDIRRQPGSRRHPHFSKDSLEESLREAGIAYEHAVDLGGHREPREDSANLGWKEPYLRGYADHAETELFQMALERVILLAEQEELRGGRLVVACAEREPLDCHRQVLADALVAAGAAVMHVIDTSPPLPHVPPAFARFDGTGVHYPAIAPIQGSLFA